jgi:hypothetical protein
MSTNESIPTSGNRPRFGLSLPVLLVLVFVVGYALSPGPVIKVFGVTKSPVDLEKLYAPLIYLYDNVPAVRDFYEWYLPLWGVK